MGVKKIDPKQQFSKWLARYGAIVWGIYSFVVLALIAYRPETAMSCVYLTLIMTANKALDTISYTSNSKTEKLLLTLLDKARMEINIGGKTKAPAEEGDGHESEGDSNG